MDEPHGPHGDPLWHVTLTLFGEHAPMDEVREAVERLREELPFMIGGRVGTDRVVLRYVDEAPDLLEASRLALGLWIEHRESADLPDWDPVGLEVIDRDLYHDRFAHGWGHPPLHRTRDIRPL